MNWIIFEILILFQKTLSQYAPNQNYHYMRQYTQAAYYLPFHNEEYIWTKSDRIKIRKPHKRRKKYNDYYISAEMDYNSKRLQCKCTCKRKYYTTRIQDYEQNDQCCQSYCDNNSDGVDRIYTPTQYPDTVNNRMYTLTPYPYTVDNAIYTPAPYPSMIYPTFDLSEIGKAFPWLTWGMTKTTKIDNDEKDKDRTITRDERDKPSIKDYSDIISTIDDRDKTVTKSEKDKSTTISDRDRTITIDDRDKHSKKDDEDKTTTKNDRDRHSKEEKDKTSTKEKPAEGSTPQTEESTPTEPKPSTIEPTQSITEPTLSTEKPTEGSTPQTEESTPTEPKPSTIEPTQSITEPTLSTFPYTVSENIENLFHYLPKKKHCLRNNNNCSRKDAIRKIGRYYKDELIERPTVASYLNGNKRRNNVPGKLYEHKSHYFN